MSVHLDNMQFRQFVQFAERQKNPANSEAVARVTGAKDPLAGRAIAASTTDRVHHWYNYTGRRSDVEATENNDTRALFRETVESMFGGMANVPESVKTAMRLDDYNQGKPLTARRIIAVRDAILQAADEVKPEALDRQKAESLVNDAIANFDKEHAAKRLGKMILGSGLREQIVDMVAKHGAGLTADCQRILANYLVPTMFSGGNTNGKMVEDTAAFIADCLKNVRDFKPGKDYRLFEVDKKLQEYLQDSIADGQKPENAGEYDKDGISAAFKTAAGKSKFTINGQTAEKGNADAVAEKFKEAIPNPQHRKIISSVMNKTLRNIIANSQTRDDLDETSNFRTLNLAEVKGSDILLTVPQDNPVFHENGITSRYQPTFTLSVNGDKAKITCNVRSDLTFNAKFADYKWLEFRMGEANNRIECEFDLSDPNTAKLTGVHLGQTVEP